MLHQYGIAAPSSLAQVFHPEDAQPNEGIHGRNQKLPPRILGPPLPYRGTDQPHRGAFRGRAMYRGGPFTQHAVRGNSSWRDRGRGHGSYRGGGLPSQHWSREQSGASSAAPVGIDAVRLSGSNPILKPVHDWSRGASSATPIGVNTAPAPISTSSSTTASNTPNNTQPQDRSYTQPAPTHTISEPPSSRTVHLPQWLLRSRSPSPKLPPTPLKRRKLDSDDELPSILSPSSVSTIEAIPALIPQLPIQPKPHIPLPARASKRSTPATPVRNPTPAADIPQLVQPKPRIPLPGKRPTPPTPVREPTPPADVKEERISPVKVDYESPLVKDERRSPSIPPSIEPERQLITESVNFYPLTASCRKSNPQFADERRSYFRQKHKELLRLGLKKTKAFWRDDGLVIEWSSDVPVWSDTLKPDIPDLATAIERAYALNDSNLPHSATKRKRRNSLLSDTSSSRSISIIEAPAPSSSQPPPAVKRRQYNTKSPVKHWADGIPLEELQRAPNLLTPSPVRDPRAKRPSLPTRMHIKKPTSLPKPPFTQPDPSAVIPSQEWRMRQTEASKRMIFKPTNPRKSQTATHDAPAGALGPAQRAKEPLNAIELAQPVRNGASQAGRDCSRETMPARFDLSHPSRKSTTPGDVPTSEGASRSPTLVNETLSTTLPHDQQAHFAEEDLQFMPEHVPVSAAASRPTDAGEEDSGCVATNRLRGTPDPEDLYLSSEDDGIIDEEVEHIVQQFISKYASMFDSDRHNLKKAYSKDALFSCRVHHADPYSCASLFVPESNDSFRSIHSRASASQVIRGRTHICDRLLTLGQYQFIPRGVPQNPLYTWSIPKSSGVQNGILLSLHGEVVKTEANPALDHRLTVDQTFLLRQRAEEDDTDDDDGTDIPGQTNLKNFWPLTIVSHQMTVRSNPLLNTDDLEDRMPWVRDILT